jgi:hypothetical protein
MGDEGAPVGRAYKGAINEPVVRTYKEERKFIKKLTPWKYEIESGFVPGMRCNGTFYVNSALEQLVFDELECSCSKGGGFGGFLPAVKQIANVAALPGIVHKSIGLPDVHSGYGFAIGNVAAFDMDNPESIVSPGGVGFDINCGVRLLRTNLMESDVAPVKEALAQSLFDHIPVGVGSKGVIPITKQDLNDALEMGIDWSIREGYAWAEDKGTQSRLPAHLAALTLFSSILFNVVTTFLLFILWAALFRQFNVSLQICLCITVTHSPVFFTLRCLSLNRTLRGVRPHAAGRPFEGQRPRQEARPAPARHAGCW